tara:strand:+ start:1372 stop:1587 length:216 start_codon:yes stop_codon:yes gene_type:complete
MDSAMIQAQISTSGKLRLMTYAPAVPTAGYDGSAGFENTHDFTFNITEEFLAFMLRHGVTYSIVAFFQLSK